MTEAVGARPDRASEPVTSVASIGARAMPMATPRPPSIWLTTSTAEVRRWRAGSPAAVTGGTAERGSGGVTGAVCHYVNGVLHPYG
ncbi:hypothetical protein GCM10010498_42850 [Streptomyces cavourensis]|nr:hypothetical protein GCM10010498_42850 [Streptomyces cavourensis]